MLINFGFGDLETFIPRKGVINWGKYLSQSLAAAKAEGAIKCPYLKDVPDYPTFNLVSKDHCKSACGGEGCDCLKLCWGKTKCS